MTDEHPPIPSDDGDPTETPGRPSVFDNHSAALPDPLLDEPVRVARTIEERFADRIEMRVPDRHNPKLQRVIEWVNTDDELYGYWIASNVTAVERLGMSDHGPVHVKIVMNLAVRLLRLLTEQGVEASVVSSFGLDREDAEVVVALASLLHDIGMSIHRNDHENYSLFLASDILRRLLPELYDARTAVLLRSEILHAIIGHRSDGVPLTLEGAVVRVADALDMAKGRSRIPYEAGSGSIHSLSAAAVERVHLTPGEDRPVRIAIELSNSAGIFQLDQLFRKKLKGSGLEEHIELDAFLEGQTEKRLFRTFRL